MSDNEDDNDGEKKDVPEKTSNLDLSNKQLSLI